MTADLFADTALPYTNDADFTEKLKEISRELKAANSLFNLASEPLEIESAIYRLSALEAEYRHAIIKAKLERICCTEATK